MFSLLPLIEYNVLFMLATLHVNVDEHWCSSLNCYNWYFKVVIISDGLADRVAAITGIDCQARVVHVIKLLQ